MTLTKRRLIRLCMIPLAAITALSVKNYKLMRRADAAERSVNNSYTAALEELASSCDDLSTVLEKQLYAGSGQVQQSLAVDLYKEAASAKAALSRLPVAKIDLQNTNKFLSQVGNYSLSLSKKLMDGEELSPEEYSNIARLCAFSKTLSDELWMLEGEISGGELSFEETQTMLADKEPPHVTEGFTDFEGGFDNDPKLIYDGPFSDNILEKTPHMTAGADKVSREVIHNSIGKGYSSISVKSETYNVLKTDWQYMMLPVWFMSYKYKDKVYEFAMNGQTGKLAGTPPLSKPKLAGFTSAIGAVAALIFFIGGLLIL